ncbi:protein MIZU-KUSSEI 1-like [Tripterygium wilfordii]|uniref:Protein MIZU-KUSSEI 1-like n=1 Tax=Tripterygium wilfordii TaxID=458696 RepID=A0A7J7DMM6_TRIWF|nr:protein MIZU-KUSSEI 1-like [Tripterygium wilfordii]
MSYTTVATTTTITNGITAVDCQKQVRSRRLLRALLQLLIPTCYCTITEEEQETKPSTTFKLLQYYLKPTFNSSSTTITGTIFGYRRGKVSFCIQSNSKSTTNPILLLELAVPTITLAKEMKGGVLRIALECNINAYDSQCNDNSLLLSMPLWTMYCNGRIVGYAVKRRPSKGDMDAINLMSSIVAGAGVISGKELEIMYLRAKFETVLSSSDSESFHLIDPDGSIGQELSIFFLRSRWS